MQGTAKLTPIKQIYAISIPAGLQSPITEEELKVLYQIPSNKWIPVRAVLESLKVDPELLADLADKGLLLSDQAGERFVELRKRDKQLSSNKWNIYAALYHFMTKWQDVSVGINLPEDFEGWEKVGAARQRGFKKFLAQHGYPPGHFHKVTNVLRIKKLPMVKNRHALYKILLKRKTTRALDNRHPLRLEELSTILYYVYGCQGYAVFQENVIGLKKTSPSGGDLHPTEVYPLILSVSGLDSGLYHYNVRDHSLELIEAMDMEAARRLSDKFTAGQSFTRWAHVLFIMTARFYRNFWKYQGHQKAYAVLLMDAAHLSQTFYLVCAQLGLGAFFTAAINAVNIEGKLGLDGFEEGALGICGCGRPSRKGSPLDPEFRRYVPRKTRL